MTFLFAPELRSTMSYLDRIQIDAAVCGGRPVVRGTPVPVAIVAAATLDTHFSVVPTE